MHLVEVDKDTLIRAREGDHEAWEQIYRVYAPVVYNISYRVTGSISDACEVTREVFVNILMGLKKFDIESSGFSMRVFGIAVKMSLMQLSPIKRLLDKIFTFELPNDYGSDTKIPEESANDAQARLANEEANKKLMKLAPKLRAVLILREMEGLSCEEIAKTLKISEKTVKSYIKKARYKFMQQGALSR